jgi:Virulence-associated protein E/Bifunctional DNA primase/polymerase, N-terminal
MRNPASYHLAGFLGRSKDHFLYMEICLFQFIHKPYQAFPKAQNINFIMTSTAKTVQSGLFHTDREAFKTQLIDGLMALPDSYSLVCTETDEKGHPTKGLKVKDWQNTEFDRKDIANRIKSGNGCGVGIKLGEPSGCVVALDVDGLVAQKALADILGGASLPKTVSFTSGKAGCAQYLFKVPTDKQEGLKPKKETHGNVASGKSEDLDFRWTGNQSVLPPSAHPETDGYYWLEGCSPCETEIAELPETLLNFWLSMINPVKATTPPNHKKQSTHSTPYSENKDFDHMLADSVAKVANCKEGGRNANLNKVAATMAGRFPDRAEDIRSALREAGLQSGLEPNEVEATLKSAITFGVKNPIGCNGFKEPNGRFSPTILTLDESIRSHSEPVRLNLMTGLAEVGDEPLDLNQLRRFTMNKFGYTLSTEDCQQCWVGIAQENSYHPVREYLTALPSDTPLIDLLGLAKQFLGNDSEMAAILLKRKLIAAVARVMNPGCKDDSLLVLVGAQGVGKTTFIEALASIEWFSNDLSDITNKQHLRLLVENWLIELGEVDDVMNRKTNEAMKHFLSKRDDTYCPPYGRGNVTAQRASTMFATSNKLDLLNDPTGTRRYWVIETKQKINITQLEGVRDSIWYSALQAMLKGEQWWLTDTEDELLKEYSKQFTETDPWVEVITWDKVARKHGKGYTVHPPTLYEHLKLHESTLTKAIKSRISAILKQFGFEYKAVSIEGKTVKIWKTETKTW